VPKISFVHQVRVLLPLPGLCAALLPNIWS
jgi:hypothetical protein